MQQIKIPSKIIFLVGVVAAVFYFFQPLQSSATSPSDYGLKEGDLISAIFSDDPDVYIINEHGYKRLFLNPEIFKFYAHLGGFTNVKLVTSEIRDAFPTVGLFRNCEKNDPKVYGFEADDEDSGKLRWVDISGEQAVEDDPDFFKKVFCINEKEFKWYPKGEELKTVKEVPQYHRATPATPAIPAIPAIPASPSQPLVSPTVTPTPASGSFTPTPTPASLTQSVTPAQPATPATPAQPTTSSSTPTPTPTLTVSPTPTTTASPSFSPTPTPTPTPITATGYAVCGQTVKNVPGDYSSIQAAIDASNPGDTIRVAAGIYYGTLEVKSGICLEGAGIDQTIIIASPSRYSPSGLYLSQIVFYQASYSIIKNFTVKNSGFSGASGGGIRVENSNNILIESCRITQNTATNGGGIDVYSNSSNVTVSKCLIDDNYGSNAGAGVVVSGSTATFNNVTIVNNRTKAGRWGGGLVLGDVSNVSVLNSIIWGNQGSLINFAEITAGTNNYNISYSDIGGWSGGTGNISLDPQFVSSTDYHLKSTSPASGMGVYPTPISTPTPTPSPTTTASVSFDNYSRNLASVPKITIIRDLYRGTSGNDVRQLQAFLVNEVGFPSDLLTGYFGSITRNAVKRLQEKYGVKPTSGYFGEITRKALRAFISN